MLSSASCKSAGGCASSNASIPGARRWSSSTCSASTSTAFPAAQIIPVINRLAAAFRAKGGVVAWVSMTAGRDGESLWPLYHDHFFSADNGARHRDGLTKGNPGHELHPDLDVRPGDIQATKNRFSAFFPGACDLHEQLVQRGIQNVAIG